MARKQANATLDTRKHLLQLAARMFGMQGYAATSMRTIARQAGIEAASIYYHFASKEELADEVLAHGSDSMVRHVAQHLAALPPRADAETRFRTAVRGQVSAVLRYGDYTIASDRLLAQMPEGVRTRQLARRAQHQALWASLVEDLRAQGVLRSSVDPALLRLFIQSCVNSAPGWFDPGKGSLERVADQLCGIFLEGIRAPARAAAC